MLGLTVLGMGRCGINFGKVLSLVVSSAPTLRDVRLDDIKTEFPLTFFAAMASVDWNRRPSKSSARKAFWQATGNKHLLLTAARKHQLQMIRDGWHVGLQ